MFLQGRGEVFLSQVQTSSKVLYSATSQQLLSL